MIVESSMNIIHSSLSYFMLHHASFGFLIEISTDVSTLAGAHPSAYISNQQEICFKLFNHIPCV